MAKSARASSVKKNNQRLKKNVFGPVETARNNRLSAKLLELASQPKPPRTDMEIEQYTAEDTMKRNDKATDGDVDMDVDESTKSMARSNNATKKQKGPKSARVDKKRHRRVRNSITFSTRGNKVKKSKKS